MKIELGALARDLKDQFPPTTPAKLLEDLDALQKDSDAITRLHLHGYLSDSLTTKARQRLIREIQKAVDRAAKARAEMA